MTPQLARAVKYLTCPQCAGNGTVATRHDLLSTTGCLYRLHAQTTCTACRGTGMRENRPT